IGTVSPQKLVHIYGTAGILQALQPSTDNAISSTLYMGATTSNLEGENAQFGYDGANNYAFIKTGTAASTATEKLVIQRDTGNVGIGTTAPAYALDVVGTAGFSSTIHAPSIGAGTDDSVVVLDSSGNFVTDEIDSRVWGSTLLAGSSLIEGYLTRVSDTNTLINSFVFDTGTAIGIGTTAPAEELEVFGSIRLSDNLEFGTGQKLIELTDGANDDLFVRTSGSLILDADEYIAFRERDDSFQDIMRINLNTGNVGIGNTSPFSLLDVNGTAWLRGNGTEGLYVGSGGFVGIGITNPLAVLEIAPTTPAEDYFIMRSAAATYEAPKIRWRKSRGTLASPDVSVLNDELGSFHFQQWDGSGWENSVIFGAVVDGTPGNNDTPGRFYVAVAADGSNAPVEALTIKNTGYVGIGNSNPGGPLVVNPPANFLVTNGITIPADACGTIKPIYAGGNRTTHTTNTFTNPDATLKGCIMTVVNVDAVDTITLDANTNFKTRGGANVVLDPYDSVIVVSDGAYWYQAGYESSNADIAEWYDYSGSKPESGDVVSITGDFVEIEKTGQAYDIRAIGIISTRPDTVLGQQSDDSIAVALAGRVPVKVILSAGEQIQSGDPLTASGEAGLAMKATAAGQTIGKALESTTNWSAQSCPTVNSVDDISWPEDDGTNPDKPCYRLPSGDYVGKIMAFVNTSWYDPGIEESLATIQSDVELIKSILQINGLTPETSASSESAPDLLTSLQAMYDNFVQLIEALGLKQVDGELVVESAMNVLGSATFTDVTITGDLMAGLLKLDTIANSLDIVGPACYNAETGVFNESLCEAQTLYVQQTLTGRVDFMAGAIVLEPNGTIKIAGDLELEGKIKAGESMRGTITVPAGEESIRIEKDWSGIPASVVATPTFDARVWVSEVDTAGFTVNINAGAEEGEIYWIAIW
ncbi:MAG: hypothetical protein ABIH84_01340, partial [bacterium]